MKTLTRREPEPTPRRHPRKLKDGRLLLCLRVPPKLYEFVAKQKPLPWMKPGDLDFFEELLCAAILQVMPEKEKKRLRGRAVELKDDLPF
jgi:hypothetical protein